MASDLVEETPLEGGGLTEVVRVGETVRRTAGSWTPAVHALLRHLESARFAGAPRSRGTDERGREALTWIDGEQSSWYADDDLAAFGHLVRELHDATAGFAAPAGALWQRMVGAPVDGPVICHNDLSADNAIRTPSGRSSSTGTSPPRARGCGTSRGPRPLGSAVRRRDVRRLDIPVPDRARLRLLVDAYGLDAADRAALLPTLEARIECLIATARTWGAQGRPGWVDVWRDTGGRQWQAGLAYVRSQRGAWAQAPR